MAIRENPVRCQWIVFDIRFMNACLWSFCLVVLVTGCGGKNTMERVVVSGKVTYQGQPVDQGTILLIPTAATKGPNTAAAIVDGRYEITATGGVPLGTHRVEIKGTRPRGGKQPKHQQLISAIPDPVDQYLPAKYNTESEMTITVKSTMTRDFDLE